MTVKASHACKASMGVLAKIAAVSQMFSPRSARRVCEADHSQQTPIRFFWVLIGQRRRQLVQSS
jgi:hypothetical protein